MPVPIILDNETNEVLVKKHMQTVLPSSSAATPIRLFQSSLAVPAPTGKPAAATGGDPVPKLQRLKPFEFQVGSDLERFMATGAKPVENVARPLRSDAASVRSVSTDPYEDYRSQPYEFFKDADPEDFLYPYARKGCFIQLHEGHHSDQVPTSPEPDKVQKTSPESAKVSKSDLEALEKKSDLFAIDKKEDEVGKE
ncbi:unnamed protein product, partial [Durusdinium trenchii]